MIHANDKKLVAITPPAAIVNNASAATTEIDTKGFEYCTVYVLLGATDIALTALKMQESDTSGSGHADISGLDYSSDGTLPSATDDNKIFAFNIDLRNRKRYLDLVATVGNGTTGAYVTAWAELSRAHTSPDSATERGVAAELTA